MEDQAKKQRKSDEKACEQQEQSKWPSLEELDRRIPSMPHEKKDEAWG